MKIGFVMDPIEKIKPAWDSTIPLMVEAQARGHNAFYLETQDLFLRKDKAYGRMTPIIVKGPRQCHKSKAITQPLDKLDVIFMRKDPPYDHDYIYTTFILEKTKAFVINKPEALRNGTEKSYITQFPRYIPDTLIAKDVAVITISWHTNERLAVL